MEKIPAPSDVVEKVSELLADLYRSVDQAKVGEVMDAVADYADVIKEKYPDTYKNTRAYHALIGSSRTPEMKIKDFPGDDSALIFLQGLRTKYLKQNE